MNLSLRRLDTTYALAFTCFLLLSSFFPAIKLYFFAPAIVITIYKKQRIAVLWYSLACGLFMDLLGSYGRLGIYSISFTLAALVSLQLKRRFFADSLSTLPIVTWFFSSWASLFAIIVHLCLDGDFQFHPLWVIGDLALMPLADALYGSIVFILPYFFFGKRLRRPEDYFMPQRP